MTTSGVGRKPSGRQAAVPGTGRAAAHLPDGDTAPTTSHADAQGGPPDEVQELQQEIEQTREQLGETVEQLVAKADVMARAKGQASAAAVPVWQATPEPARQAVAKGAGAARQHRVPLAAAASALIAGLLVTRWCRKR